MDKTFKDIRHITDVHVALAWAEVSYGLLFPFLGSQALLLQHWQSL
jgi:hypothetical protein